MSKQIFAPGTIILQYDDDSHRYVGVVVDPNTNKKNLSDYDKKLFSDYYQEGRVLGTTPQISLVLGLWGDYEDSSPVNDIFNSSRLKPFPWYRVGFLRHAEDIGPDLEKAWQYHSFIKSRSTPKELELNCGSLFPRIFGFSRKQIQTLQVWQCVCHYLKGGNLDTAPKGLIDSYREVIYKELEIALPR